MCVVGRAVFASVWVLRSNLYRSCKLQVYGGGYERDGISVLAIDFLQCSWVCVVGCAVFEFVGVCV